MSNILLDIIIPGYGNLPLLRRCLRSIQKHTPNGQTQVIYVDNGTGPEDLAQLIIDYPELTVVHLPNPAGFVRPINIGMSLALMQPAPFLMWLNNDTEVEEGWLEKLLGPFEDAQVGAVGGVSDKVYGVQHREARAPDGDWIDVPILIGFALAVRKEAIKQIGFLDERFAPGNYEDWDYSLRLREKGWHLIVNEQVWIEHKLHQTFGKVTDFDDILAANLKKFVDKWGQVRLAEMGINIEPPPAIALPVVDTSPDPSIPQAVRIVTHTTGNWLPNIRPYLNSLKQHSPWQTYLMTVGFSTNGDTPDAAIGVPCPVVPGSPEYSHSLQHGGFLPYVPGPDDDVLIYTDGDILMQRAPSDTEREMVQLVPEGVVLAGYNSGPFETLALEASRLSPRVDIGTVFDARLVATAACYNLGVTIARRSTWRKIHSAYLQLYPVAQQVFAHPARQQWLVNYVIAALGLTVIPLPYLFHLHGCYTLPEGGAVVDGVATYNGEPVLFRHHV